jgi:hypothetical protein
MTLEEAQAIYEKEKDTPEYKARMERLRNIRDEDIDFSDCPEMTEEDFASGRLKLVRHGGARAGAGRKPLGKARMTVQLSPSRVAQIRAFAKRKHKTLSAVVDECLVLK